VILAIRGADAEARAFWGRVIESGKQSEGDLAHAIAYVEETGAIRETLARAQAYADSACDALGVLPPSPLREALVAVADFCVERAY